MIGKDKGGFHNKLLKYEERTTNVSLKTHGCEKNQKLFFHKIYK